MSKGTSCFFKGMATGVAVGMSICCSVKMLSNRKCAKNKIGNAVKTVSDFMENISYMMR